MAYGVQNHIMLRPVLLCLIVLLTALGPNNVAAQATVTSVVWQVGDDPDWSRPEHDDVDWRGLDDEPWQVDRVFWVRVRLDASTMEAPALSVRSNAVFDVFLDGLAVGTNRQVGADMTRPQANLVRFGLPSALLVPGAHVLAFRIDGQGVGSDETVDLRFTLEEAALITRSDRVRDAVDGAAAFLAGFLFLTAVGIWLWGARRPELAMVAGLCVSAVVIFALDTDGRAFAGQALPPTVADAFLVLASMAIYALTAAITHRRLGLDRPGLWFALAAGCLVIALMPWPFGSEHADQRAFFLLSVLIGAMSLTSFRQHPALSSVHAGASLVCLIAVLLFGEQMRIFLAVLVALVSIAMIVDVILGEINMRKAEARASRLQAALVRRNIQPHFIMNSLTVALELQETNASAARDFIKALSDEFRALALMIDQPRVRLRDELALCRSHLAMMGLRLEASLNLVTHNLDEEAECPPGLFHTVLENAISHNRYEARDVTFVLEAAEVPSGLTYIFRAPVISARTASPVGSGSGTRYVEARLEEFRPGGWTCNSQREGDDWVTRIELRGGRR